MLHLFVYGTLKRGQRHHHLLYGQTFVQVAATEPHYRLLDCGSYPALIASPENGLAIQGEVFLIDPAILPSLDRLEDAPHLYQLLPIRLQDVAFTVAAYLYLQDSSSFPDCGESWS